MDEQKMRTAFAASAGFWLGAHQGDERHKQIVDIYNTIKPLPRGYTVKYTDAWCATFVSAVANNFGMEDLFPYECSCYYMVMKLIKMGRWIERDDFVPSTGDLIFYDWKDSVIFENTDNVGVPGHVGIVESVIDGKITAIEGNKSNSVGKREVPVNGRYIRGFGHLDFSRFMFEPDLNWASKNKLFIGDENGDFHWKENVTREELATVLHRFSYYFN